MRWCHSRTIRVSSCLPYTVYIVQDHSLNQACNLSADYTQIHKPVKEKPFLFAVAPLKHGGYNSQQNLIFNRRRSLQTKVQHC